MTVLRVLLSELRSSIRVREEERRRREEASRDIQKEVLSLFLLLLLKTVKSP